MKKAVKYLFLLAFLASCLSLLTTSLGNAQTGNNSARTNSSAQEQAPRDTTNRFPVKKTQITNYEDIAEKKPIDLRDPSNVKTEIVYDYKTNSYIYKTKIGDQEWITPFSMSADEYNDLSLKKGMADYFKKKNDELFEKGTTKDQFALKDIKVPIGAAERVFGPGGVKVRPQGFVELSMGVKRTTNNSPTLSQSRRSTTLFDVDEKINMSVDASIGDKMNFNLNYNTEATFDFDSKRMKLAYEGKEDEIIKYLEAGNVSLNTTNSLIGGSTSLFGIRADLQFGKLRVNTVVSQQQSESTTAKSSGGIQTRSFSFKASDYEENRHFFLSEYFRDNYDKALSQLPYIESIIRIEKIEVWVTNKRGNFSDARDVVAFADLAEVKHINNKKWLVEQDLSGGIPFNGANDLYSKVTSDVYYEGTRNNNEVIQVLSREGLELGQDYEKVESARLLSSSEYTLQPQLGYISVDGYSLQQDEVLAVAFSYTVNGVTYQVGDFASQITNVYDASNKSSGSLILKLLKPTSLSPISYSWNLMMKNIYRIGAYNIQSDRFRLNIAYQNDTIGTYMDYLTEGKIKDLQLIKVMNLDRLNARNNVVRTTLDDGRTVYGDGIFDFVEGYTIRAAKGVLIFPVVEPFGKHLAKEIGDTTIAKKYIYPQLYDTTLTVAKQATEFDKYKIYGSYRASNSNEIDLGVTNVVPGSVRVTAGGVLLKEGQDYTVDYFSGTVTITNTQYSNSQISATVENQTLFNMQTRTMLGANVSYEFNKDFSIGTTVLHLYEKPINTKMGVGSESVNNTLVGFNMSWRKQSQWLTNLVDKLPFVEATAPSQIQFEGEFAKMFADHYKGQGGGYSYLDDFETSRSRISIKDPYGWNLSSVPEPLLHSKAYQDIENGNNRALMAWYYIDNMFTRKNSSLRPSYFTNDDLSNHYVREILYNEIYPYREQVYNESSALSVMNISFYPEERGPYNLDTVKISSEGKLLDPQKRWGGMSRKIETQNFEAANVQYIEFWLLDPFIYDRDSINLNKKGGNLYFNLGDISEDVLRDGLKFYENGLGMPGDTTLYTTTVWGHVPKRQSTVYAFDFSDGKDALLYAQDVGFNGLSTEQELGFKTYKDYIEAYKAKVTNPDAYKRLDADPFSPFNDPAGDNFHYFRGSDLDEAKASIHERYKYINGTERNTVGSTKESYTTSMKRTPDVEDINQDYTMNEAERYYQYKVPIYPDSLDDVSNRYITDRRKVEVNLPNGKKEEVTWYQFKIPINDPDSIVGRLNNLSSIRFMRMYLKGFTHTTHLRFATLDLVKGDWRIYSKNLTPDKPEGTGNLELTSVNLEENGNRKPVNYVVPPGVSRILDPGQPQLRLENEQALSMRVKNLGSESVRGIYKNTSYDLRRYKRIEMFTHAENFENENDLKKGDFYIFMRLGTDYENNYYEYEIPMEVTPPGTYSTHNPNDRLAVWPKNNMFDFPLELLKNVKLNRNRKKRQTGSDITYTKVYSEADPNKPSNTVRVKGNPSLSEVNIIMIGIKNGTRFEKSGEVWINELRVTDFDEEGGWAAKGNLSIALSDIGMVQLSGHKETIGFGSIDQSLMERRSDDYESYSISTSVDAGRFLPKQAKVTLPLYYTYTNETNTPKYDPLDQDVTLKESLSIVNTKQEKDSIKNLAQTKQVSRSFNITGAKLNIRSKEPMPYDPANLTFSYSNVKTTYNDPTTSYDTQLNTSTIINYTYSPIQKTWAPFKDSKSKSPLMKFPKAFGINYVPNSISINSNLYRVYFETMTRDLESLKLGENNTKREMLTFSGEYYWDRDFSLNWDFTKNLKFSIQTGTKAEIEQPFLQVNKEQNPDHYAQWKEMVNNSIKKFGNPYEYRQNASVTYNIPLNTIPILDWVTSSASYNSTYSWVKGAVLEEDSVKNAKVGNTLSNSMTLSINGRFNMVNLYNKWSFLKKVNQKFAQTSSSSRNTTSRAKKPTPRKFEKMVTLNNDSAITVTHNLKTKNIEILAKSVTDNKAYKIKFKKVDDNTIKITTKDSIELNLSIRQKPEGEEPSWYKVAQYTARGLMSVRNVSILYSKQNQNYIYGFLPNIGDFFGQSYGMTPGLGFAFGFEGDEDFLYKSKANNWLVMSDMNNTPATFNRAEKLNVDMQLEPFRGLKIDLKAYREKNDQTNIALTQDNSVRTLGGSFSMSISTLSTAFESSNLNNNYESAAFNKFLENRQILQNRLQENYLGQQYPQEGFIKDKGVGLYDKDKGTVQNSSADVLIPAFIAAYTGKDPNKVGTSPFLSLTSMIPGWNITYDGLTTLPWFKDKFKNFKLMHGYSSKFNIGSYNSFADWVSLNGSTQFGFISNQQDASMIMPSSPYNISTVSIIEAFRPLFGVEGTLKNNMTLGLRYNRDRTLNLNIASYQVVETAAKEFVITMGYRINEFNRVLGITSRNKTGFNNDLNIKADISYKSNQALLRKIENEYTQATSGIDITTLKISADYAMSRMLTIRAYFDKIINTPLISASANPTSDTNVGISVRFTLTQ